MRIKNYVFDKNFIANAIRFGFPVAMLAVIQSSLGIVDQLMVGQLGQTEIAGVGLGIKPISVFFALVYSVVGGASIYIAQYWGEDKTKSFAKILDSSFLICLIVGIAMGLASVFFGEQIMSIFTPDPHVVQIGAQFQRILVLSYLPIIYIALYSSTLRCTGHVSIPMYTGLLSVALNTFLNWIFIFGNLGAPALGVEGAAISTVIARVVETLVLILVIRKLKLPGRIKIADVMRSRIQDISIISKVTLPIVYMTITFTIADALYSSIYGYMSTESLVAMNVVFPIQGFIIAFFTGLSTAAGILIGQKLGGGQREDAFDYALKFLLFGFVLSVLVVLALYPMFDIYLGFFEISQESRELSKLTLLVISIYLWIRISNMIMMQGVLPSGGKTKQLFYINLVGQWCIALPLGYVTAFIFKLPVYWVFFAVSFEELIRWGYCLHRTMSKKWIEKLA